MRSTDSREQTVVREMLCGTGTAKLIASSASLFQTPIERRFDSLTRLAVRSLRAPVAAITGIRADEQWFKSVTGWPISKLPLNMSLCRRTAETAALQIVPNLAEDERYCSHPLVRAKPGFRFYAGCPLYDEFDQVAGTFCVIDVKPRTLGIEDRRVFMDLAGLVQREMGYVDASATYEQLISKLRTARREALVDPLTRVWNRRAAELLLGAIISRSDEENSGVSVCVIDFDYFKDINDQLGHQAGDKALRNLSVRLVDSLRRDDFVCRIGGDEFLLICPRMKLKAAQLVVERIQAELAASPILVHKRKIVPVTISVGYASRRAGEALAPLDLIGIADEQLLTQKSRRRSVRAQ